MIRIHKPRRGPAILRKRGRDETRRLCEIFEAEPDEYRSGNKTFGDFDKTIFGAASVKNALRKAQHDKCAFCEAKITHVSYGDVEHYRPKAGFVQQKGESLGRPGYYWLAYEWSNLFLSCQLCNQRFKRNLFPLRDPTRRATTHQDDLTAEEPLLIDPGMIDPTIHILWKDEYPEAIPGSQEGQASIEILGLQREELAQQRREHLRTLHLLWETVQLFRQRRHDRSLRTSEEAHLRRLEARIQELERDDSPYAAMTRAFFADTHKSK
jgi:uncharacterized protein (TIGR02646 family)